VFLDPDDGLGKVEFVCFEHRWIISTVGVTAPNVEGPARPEHARQIAEPGMQSLAKLFLRQVIVNQGAILGAEFFVSAFGFCRMPSQIQDLMVLNAFEGAEPGSDSIVGTRFDSDIEWRIGVNQVDRGTVQQTIHIFGPATVTAQQAIATEEPKISRFGDCLVGRLWNIVRIG